jgi:hypothetical protein
VRWFAWDGGGLESWDVGLKPRCPEPLHGEEDTTTTAAAMGTNSGSSCARWGSVEGERVVLDGGVFRFTTPGEMWIAATRRDRTNEGDMAWASL